MFPQYRLFFSASDFDTNGDIDIELPGVNLNLLSSTDSILEIHTRRSVGVVKYI